MSHRHEKALHHLIGSRVRADLLTVLLKEPGRTPHLRELVREAGPGISFVRRELAELERMGLLRHRRQARGIFFEVVVCHPLYHPLRDLIRAAERLDACESERERRVVVRMPYEDRGDEHR